MLNKREKIEMTYTYAMEKLSRLNIGHVHHIDHTWMLLLVDKALATTGSISFVVIRNLPPAIPNCTSIS